jgi:hypothetical protein
MKLEDMVYGIEPCSICSSGCDWTLLLRVSASTNAVACNLLQALPLAARLL